MDLDKPIEITIEVATTWIRAKAERSGSIGGIDISRYFYHNLMEHEYIPRFNHWEIKARYALFDTNSSYVYMPRYSLDNLISALKMEIGRLG